MDRSAQHRPRQQTADGQVHLLDILGNDHNHNRGVRRHHSSKLCRSDHSDDRLIVRDFLLRVYDQRDRRDRRQAEHEERRVRQLSVDHNQTEGPLLAEPVIMREDERRYKGQIQQTKIHRLKKIE